MSNRYKYKPFGTEVRGAAAEGASIQFGSASQDKEQVNALSVKCVLRYNQAVKLRFRGPRK